MSDSEDDLSKGLNHHAQSQSQPSPSPATSQVDAKRLSKSPETRRGTQQGSQQSNMASSQPNGTQANSTQPETQTQNDGMHQQSPPSGQEPAAEETPIDPKQPLEAFAWDDLEDRFMKKMEECQKGEEELEKEFRGWYEVFQAWATTTREHEEERLHKRSVNPPSPLPPSPIPHCASAGSLLNLDDLEKIEDADGMGAELGGESGGEATAL
ncbi:MAG: hypothetical protein Q9202_005451 [Teloschistes flavicans]